MSCRLQSSHPVIFIWISVNRMWSSCCVIHVSHVFSKFFLFLSFTAPFLVEQRHDQPILSFFCIIQCIVRWVSGRIKSEQTTAWNKCWCTVPNIAQSVLIIRWLLPAYLARRYRIGSTIAVIQVIQNECFWHILETVICTDIQSTL